MNALSDSDEIEAPPCIPGRPPLLLPGCSGGARVYLVLQLQAVLPYVLYNCGYIQKILNIFRLFTINTVYDLCAATGGSWRKVVSYYFTLSGR